jgi:hypothetical protein
MQEASDVHPVDPTGEEIQTGRQDHAIATSATQTAEIQCIKQVLAPIGHAIRGCMVALSERPNRQESRPAVARHDRSRGSGGSWGRGKLRDFRRSGRSEIAIKGFMT